MRLGGPLPQNYSDPDAWIAAVKERGYRAAYCPVEQIDQTINAYAQAARQTNVIIAEVGAWRSNPLSKDEHERRKAVDYCQRRLALADAIGALCCVNISGSRGSVWDGPHPDNLTTETFDLIVEMAPQRNSSGLLPRWWATSRQAGRCAARPRPGSARYP